MPLKSGPSGTAHPSDCCAVVFFEIAADLESQLEIVSEVPEGSVRFSPDGWLPHLPSLVRTAAWGERSVGVDEGCVLSTPGSAEEERISLSLPVAKARREGLFEKPISEASRPSPMLTHMEDFAGWLAALEVSGVAPNPTLCSSSPAMLGIPAASRKQPSAARGSHSAWGRCRHQSRPSPCQASSRSPTKKRCASPPTSRSCRTTRKVGYVSGQAQWRTLTGGRVPRCSAFYAPVTNTLEWRRTRRECGKI